VTEEKEIKAHEKSKGTPCLRKELFELGEIGQGAIDVHEAWFEVARART
jgi:hypothetical protein